MNFYKKYAFDVLIFYFSLLHMYGQNEDKQSHSCIFDFANSDNHTIPSICQVNGKSISINIIFILHMYVDMTRLTLKEVRTVSSTVTNKSKMFIQVKAAT